MPAIITEYPHFFTASIFRHQYLLAKNKYKDVVLKSMEFIVKDGRVRIYAFVIMSNHIHLIWQMQPGKRQSDVQRDFLKFTAQKIQRILRADDPDFLKKFRVVKNDRQFQFWQDNALSVRLWCMAVFDQTLNYIPPKSC